MNKFCTVSDLFRRDAHKFQSPAKISRIRGLAVQKWDSGDPAEERQGVQVVDGRGGPS